jgi:beta-lactamase class A
MKICKLFLYFCVVVTLSACHTENTNKKRLHQQLNSLEIKYHGRLGIAAINTNNGKRFDFNDQQRFPMTSTFKFMLVAAVLKKTNDNKLSLNKNITYSKKVIADAFWTPVTDKHIKTGMTIKALCKAAIQQSDNAAANLLINELGGTKAVNQFARSIGDKKFNLVRTEPNLNSAIPGDKRDTTTPLAMVDSMNKILLGKVLSKEHKELLTQWLIENKTGDNRIRAGVPKNWRMGDKTGTGAYGATNDIAILWPPHKKPIILVIYFTTTKQTAKSAENVIASATKLALERYEQQT